jgi:hypothetical protein
MEAGVGIALGGIVLSIFTVYFNYLNGKDAREDARALARETREAQATEARSARIHESRKAVYVEILEYVFRTEDSVDRTEPLLTWDGMPVPPEWPSEDEIRRQNARTSAFGSAPLRDKLRELKTAVQEFQGAVFELRVERDGPGRATNIGELYQKVAAKRDVVKAAVKEAIEVANRELAE